MGCSLGHNPSAGLKDWCKAGIKEREYPEDWGCWAHGIVFGSFSSSSLSVFIGQFSACCHGNADPRQEMRVSVGKWPTMTRAGV